MKAQKGSIGLTLAAFILLFAQPAVAAPFCMVTPDGGHCSYYSYDQCMHAAGGTGICAVNTAEIHQPAMVAPFCVVTPYSGATQCTYYDYKSCNDAAQASSGVCLGTRREVATAGQGVTTGMTKLGTPGVGNLGVAPQGNMGAAAPQGNVGVPSQSVGPSIVPGQTVPPTELRR